MIIDFPKNDYILAREKEIEENLNRLRKTNPEMFNENGELKKEYRI